MKNILRLLGCVLALVLGVAAADPQCPKKYFDKDCTNSDASKACSIPAQWLLAMEKCPEATNKHSEMLMPYDREFLIYSNTKRLFKIANIKEYNVDLDQSGNPYCAWNSEPFEPKDPPFTDDTDGGLTAFSHEHDLKIKEKCMACYKLDLIFNAPGKSGSGSGESTVDPHIQTGGGNAKFKDTCVYQKCFDKTHSEDQCLNELKNLSTTR